MAYTETTSARETAARMLAEVEGSPTATGYEALVAFITSNGINPKQNDIGPDGLIRLNALEQRVYGGKLVPASRT